MNIKKAIFAFILVIAIISGILLVILLRQGPNNIIRTIVLKENGVTKVDLEYSANGLKPTESCDYELDVTAKVAESYKFDFSFREKKDGGLRNFVDVTVACGTECVTYSMDELFNGQTIKFTCQVEEKTPTVFTVIFTMRDAGNEAQGAESDFMITLTAEKA